MDEHSWDESDWAEVVGRAIVAAFFAAGSLAFLLGGLVHVVDGAVLGGVVLIAVACRIAGVAVDVARGRCA